MRHFVALVAYKNTGGYGCAAARETGKNGNGVCAANDKGVDKCYVAGLCSGCHKAADLWPRACEICERKHQSRHTHVDTYKS